MDETTTATPEAEVFEFKHPKTHRTLTLPMKIGEVDLKGLLEGTIEKSKVDAKNKVQAQLAELEAKANDYDAMKSQLDELQSSGLTAAERKKKDDERVQGEIKRAKDEAERYKSSLHAERVGNAVYSEFGKVKGIVDINKASTLFKAECNPRLIERAGEFITVADYDGQELAISEAHAKWIARDDNKFLLQNTLSPGGGSTGSTGAVKAKQMTRADFDALKPAERMAFINDGGTPV